jgi:oligoendopeptidase F
MSLDQDSAPPKLYDTLISEVSDPNNLSRTTHKYVELKQRALGLDSFEFYDVYAYLYSPARNSIDYEKARRIIKKALLPLGENYTKRFENASKPGSGWVDVYPRAGKLYIEGAMTIPMHGVHPYVLLNYRNSIEDVLYMAHEFGHALHFDYASRNQPYIYSNIPSILSTEVVATLNELLVYDYLIEKAKNNEDELFYTNALMEFIRGRLIGGTMVGEFERDLNLATLNDVTLTSDTLSDHYSNLLSKYYGPSYIKTENEGMEWAYISNVLPRFYMMNYSASFVVALQFFNKIKAEGPSARDSYINFLRSGFSSRPATLLHKAGIDIRDENSLGSAVQNACNYFEDTIDKVTLLTINFDFKD